MRHLQAHAGAPPQSTGHTRIDSNRLPPVVTGTAGKAELRRLERSVPVRGVEPHSYLGQDLVASRTQQHEGYG